MSDLTAARRAVMDGDLAAALGIVRAADGELQFTWYSDDPDARRIGLLATTSLAIADRLDRVGVELASQAGLFAPARYEVGWPDPDRVGPRSRPGRRRRSARVRADRPPVRPASGASVHRGHGPERDVDREG